VDICLQKLEDLNPQTSSLRDTASSVARPAKLAWQRRGMGLGVPRQSILCEARGFYVHCPLSCGSPELRVNEFQSDRWSGSELFMFEPVSEELPLEKKS